MSTETNPAQGRPAQLTPEQLKYAKDWYNQQLIIAELDTKLAELGARKAKATFEETRYRASLMELTNPARRVVKTDIPDQESKKEEVPNPISKEE